MTEPTDHELLAQFARTGAEHPFATLVRRHVNLVYSAALRFTNDTHHAEEITQAVFILLTRKAGGISAKTILTGWLYQTTRLTAAKFHRDNQRRQQREHQAFMDSTLNQPETGETWKQLAPALDDAMGDLRDTDRNAVLLRYFENKPLAEVGVALGVSEDAARVRVNRAIEKLRQLLTKKGVTIGATAITGAVAANAVSAAPAALALSITTAALTGTVTTTLIATAPMNWISLKLVAASLAAALTAGTITYLSTHGDVKQLQTQNDTLNAQVQTMTQAHDQDAAAIADLKSQLAQINQDKSELLKLRGEVGVTRQQLTQARNENARLKAAPQISAANQPTTVQRSPTSDITDQNHCLNNLRQIDAAKNQCALEHGLTSTNYVTVEDILPYLMHNQLPTCPSGGTYTLGRLDQQPTCSVPGHALPDMTVENAAGPVIQTIMGDRPEQLTGQEINEAATLYTQYHNGQPPHGLSEILPWLKQPGPKLSAALSAYKQTHNNDMPTNALELAPYFNN